VQEQVLLLCGFAGFGLHHESNKTEILAVSNVSKDAAQGGEVSKRTHSEVTIEMSLDSC
jgi:hypothetical protein